MKTFCFALVALLFLSACASPPTPVPPTPAPTPEPTPQPPIVCNAKDCFITAANECKELEITIAEEAGAFKYASKDCMFTKTLVTPNPKETQEMKNLLQGKSLTCKYEKGKFDDRWVNSLVFGIEKCDGMLKDTLGALLAFS